MQQLNNWGQVWPCSIVVSLCDEQRTFQQGQPDSDDVKMEIINGHH